MKPNCVVEDKQIKSVQQDAMVPKEGDKAK